MTEFLSQLTSPMRRARLDWREAGLHSLIAAAMLVALTVLSSTAA